jgi:hypothetical protein
LEQKRTGNAAALNIENALSTKSKRPSNPRPKLFVAKIVYICDKI